MEGLLLLRRTCVPLDPARQLRRRCRLRQSEHPEEPPNLDYRSYADLSAPASSVGSRSRDCRSDADLSAPAAFVRSRFLSEDVHLLTDLMANLRRRVETEKSICGRAPAGRQRARARPQTARHMPPCKYRFRSSAPPRPSRCLLFRFERGHRVSGFRMYRISPESGKRKRTRDFAEASDTAPSMPRLRDGKSAETAPKTRARPRCGSTAT